MSKVGFIASFDTKKARKEAKAFDKEIKNLGTDITNAFKTTTIISWGLAVKEATKIMISASKAESDYIERTNLLKVAYHEATDEGKKLANNADTLIKKMKNFYGLDASGLTQSLGVFKQMTNAMGMANETSALLSENLLKMEEDVSSLYNLDVEVVARKFQSALAGQTRAVRDLGVDITKSALQQELYNRGINKSIDDMNRASKSVLIYLTMERQLAEANGDASRTINGVANQTRIFKEQLTIASRQIGALFIPVLKTILPLLNGILMTMNAIGEYLLKLLGVDVQSLASEFGLATISSDFDDIGASATEAGKAVDDLRGKLRGFDKLNVITTPQDSSAGKSTFGVGGGGVDKSLLAQMNEYNKLMFDVSNKAKQIRDSILDWLGFTIDENGEIEDFHWTLGSVVAMLVTGGVLYKGIKGIVGIVGNLLGMLGITGGGSTILGAFKSMFTGGATASSSFAMSLLKLGAVVMGVFYGADGIVNATKAGKEFTKQEKNTTLASLKLAGSLGEVAIGGALIGANFGPIGAIIGAVGGLVVGATASWLGYNKAMKQIIEENLFGDILISTEQWEKDLSKLNPQLNNMYEIIGQHKEELSNLSAGFESAYNSLDMYSFRFGQLGIKISEEDAPKITEAIKNTFENATKIVDENTQYQLDLYTQAFETGTTLSEEEQKTMLENIITYGNDQKKELEDAQDKVTTIYNNAIKKRGYLTDEEYKQVKEALDKIKKLTETNVEENQGKLMLMQQQYEDGKLSLNKESYKNLSEAITNYNKEVEEKAKKNYDALMTEAERYRATDNYNEEEYQKRRKIAYDTYNKQIEDGQEKLKTYTSGILKELTDTFVHASNEEKSLIENIFKDLNFDYSELEMSAKGGAGAFGDAFQSELDRRKFTLDITPELDGDYHVTMNGYDDLKVALEKRGRKGGGSYADGGFVDEGELFVAREAGPELVGRIGNKTAVANNDQIINGIAIGVAKAMSSVKNNQTINIVAEDGGILDYINFKQKQKDRQYGF